MSKDKLIDLSILTEMLYGEQKYIQEFAEAAVISFSEFNENYSRFLIAKDETNFRKAGHKIKPVCQMMGLDQILEEYEYAKKLLHENRPVTELEGSAGRIQDICEEVITELKEITVG